MDMGARVRRDGEMVNCEAHIIYNICLRALAFEHARRKGAK